MTITTASQLLTAARQSVYWAKTSSIGNASRVPFGFLSVAGTPAAGTLSIGNTSAGLVPTDATAGFPVIDAFGSGNVGYLAEAECAYSIIGAVSVFDRLYHVGSVSLTSLATTNLSSQPSFAGRLPTGSYANLEIFVEASAVVSNTATTVAVGYTNEAGTSGRSTGAVSVQSFAAGRHVDMPLQAGDKGVRQIDSITVGGTVATSGSANVFIGRRLLDFDIRHSTGQDWQGPDMTGLPIIYADSALHVIGWGDPTNTGRPGLRILVVNG